MTSEVLGLLNKIIDLDATAGPHQERSMALRQVANEAAVLKHHAETIDPQLEGSPPVVDLGLGKQPPVTVVGVGWDVWWRLLCHLEQTNPPGKIGSSRTIDALRADLRVVIDAASYRRG